VVPLGDDNLIASIQSELHSEKQKTETEKSIQLESEVVETPLSPEVVARNADMDVRYAELVDFFMGRDDNKWENQIKTDKFT